MMEVAVNGKLAKRRFCVLNGLQIAVDFASLGLRPEVFTIGPFGDWGPFSLRWYSLSYIFASLGGWWLLSKMIRRPGSPMNAEQLDSFITWATLGVIVGVWGLASGVAISMSRTITQSAASPTFLGRVLAIYSLGFFGGSSPLLDSA
jgi:hypothetical protein